MSCKKKYIDCYRHSFFSIVILFFCIFLFLNEMWILQSLQDFYVIEIVISEKRLVEKHVSLTGEEFEHIRLFESTDQGIPSRWTTWMRWLKSREPFLLLEENVTQANTVNFTGYRKRTKDILLTFMYKQEISYWIEQAIQEEEQLEPDMHLRMNPALKITH